MLSMKKTIIVAASLALSSASLMAHANTLEIRGTINYGYTQNADARTEFSQATYLIEVEQQPTMPLVYAATTWRQYSDALSQVSLTIEDAQGNEIMAKQTLTPSSLT